jgi:ubiquitin carboxyl-terminal hydrolase 7
MFFEVLDISLSELDTKKALKVALLSDGISKVVCQMVKPTCPSANFLQDTYDILVPKNGTVEDLTNALIKKAQLDDEATAGPIQIYEIHANKIHKELPHDYPVLNISEYTNIVAERIPEENLSEDENGFLIQVFHFQNEVGKSHGIPFRFRLLRVSVS